MTSLPVSKKNQSQTKRILAVSGESAIRDLLERFFELDGRNYYIASDAAEGLAKAREQPFDLVILDTHLHKCGAVRDEFKTEEATSHLPVLWVGARYISEGFAYLDTVGADRILTIPFSLEQMRGELKRLLG